MPNTGSVTCMEERDIILHAFLLQHLEVGLFYFSEFIKTVTFLHKAPPANHCCMFLCYWTSHIELNTFLMCQDGCGESPHSPE